MRYLPSSHLPNQDTRSNAHVSNCMRSESVRGPSLISKCQRAELWWVLMGTLHDCHKTSSLFYRAWVGHMTKCQTVYVVSSVSLTCQWSVYCFTDKRKDLNWELKFKVRNIIMKSQGATYWKCYTKLPFSSLAIIKGPVSCFNSVIILYSCQNHLWSGVLSHLHIFFDSLIFFLNVII